MGISNCFYSTYRLVQKKWTVLLSTSLAWPAVAGCSWGETFSQLSAISFAQPCIFLGRHRVQPRAGQARRLLVQQRGLRRPLPRVVPRRRRVRRRRPRGATTATTATNHHPSSRDNPAGRGKPRWFDS